LRRQIAVLNRCTVADDTEVGEITKVLQKQVPGDFAAAWGVDAELTFLGTDEQHGWEGKWNLVVLDTSDEANALGYHDLTPDGLPLGKAFAGTDKMAGAHLSVTMSHELLEMLGDPGINLLAPDARGRIYAYENCDAVEADELGYEIDGVLVSDFVHPEWFIPDLAHVKGVQFDHGKHVSKPFELAKGGYIGYTDVWPPNWQQIQAEGEPSDDPLTRPRVGSRRERRRTDRRSWRRSAS
jgi:hypothetical protein